MGERTTRRSLFSALVETLRRLLGQKREPEDPYAHRLAALRRGPNNRSGAAAVAEPEEENEVFPPPQP
jgi:hypothetical protein